MIWEFNNFKIDIDVTDADFIENVENSGYDKISDENVEGMKQSQIYRNLCENIENVFSKIFGEESTEKLFGGKKSAKEHCFALYSLLEVINKENEQTTKEVEAKQKIVEKYNIK